MSKEIKQSVHTLGDLAVKAANWEYKPKKLVPACECIEMKHLYKDYKIPSSLFWEIVPDEKGLCPLCGHYPKLVDKKDTLGFKNTTSYVTPEIHTMEHVIAALKESELKQVEETKERERVKQRRLEGNIRGGRRGAAATKLKAEERKLNTLKNTKRMLLQFNGDRGKIMEELGLKKRAVRHRIQKLREYEAENGELDV